MANINDPGFNTKAGQTASSGPTGGKDDGGPLDTLNQGIGASEPLYYPVDIQTVDHYMIFSAYKEHTYEIENLEEFFKTGACKNKVN